MTVAESTLEIIVTMLNLKKFGEKRMLRNLLGEVRVS
jgi:hypothetical protein